MAGPSTTVANKLLDNLFADGTRYDIGSPIYAALIKYSAPLAESDTSLSGKEIAYTSYARVAINPSDMSAASARSKTNSAAVTWPTCTGGSDIIGQVALVTTSSGACDILAIATVTPVSVSTAQPTPSIGIGNMTAAYA